MPLTLIKRRWGAVSPAGKDLMQHALLAFVVRVFGAISAYVATFFIARTLGVEESGFYFLAFAIVTILSAFGRVGLDNTVLRFAGASDEQAASTLTRGAMLAGLVSVVLASLLFVSSPLLATSVFDKPRLAPVLQAMAAGIVGYSLLTLAAVGLQAIKRVTASIFVLNIGLNMLLVAAVISGLIGSAWALAGIFSVGAAFIALFGFVLFACFRPRVVGVAVAWRTLFASCLPLAIVMCMSQLVQWSGQLVAGMYVEPEQLSHLAVAQRTAMLTSFVLVAVNLVVAPRFAALHAEGDRVGLEKMAINSVKLITAVALPVILVMLIFAVFLMGVFGEEFLEGANLLRILAIGQFINVITGSVGYLLMMSGHERDMRNITLVSGSLAIVLAFVLTPLFGAYGSATATAIAVATQNLLAVYLVKQRLGFNTLAVWR